MALLAAAAAAAGACWLWAAERCSVRRCAALRAAPKPKPIYTAVPTLYSIYRILLLVFSVHRTNKSAYDYIFKKCQSKIVE